MSRPRLRWKTKPDGTLDATLGAIPFGFVGQRDDGSVFWDATGAIVTRWTVKGRGETTTLAAGRRAVNRAWRVWYERAGLS